MDQVEVERLRRLAELEATRQHTTAELYEDIAYYGVEEAMQVAIAQTIARLPRSVQDFACWNLQFVSIGDALRGFALPGRLFSSPAWTSADPIAEDIAAPPTEKSWLIVLNDSLLLGDASPEDAYSTIAHEIAHAWLGHEFPVWGMQAFNDSERAASSQAQQWGFTGPGTRFEDPFED